MLPDPISPIRISPEIYCAVTPAPVSGPQEGNRPQGGRDIAGTATASENGRQAIPARELPSGRFP